jgi:small conductance mechanosensitive channel
LDLKKTYENFLAAFDDWADKVTHVFPNIVFAALVLVFTFLIAKYFSRFLFGLLARFSRNININRILKLVVRAIIYLVGLYIILNILNLNKAITSLLASAGIIGIALSFAFQDTAANFMAGVIIAMRRPFTVGELVESKGYLGRIEAISLRTTKLVTMQGQLVIIPNREVLQNPLLNYSYTGQRRIEIYLRISFDEDLEKVRDITLDAVEDIPFLLKNKEIEFFYKSFEDSYIKCLLRFWIDAFFQRDYLASQSQAIINIKKAYDANGIKIPYPVKIVDLEMKDKPADEIINRPKDENEQPPVP